MNLEELRADIDKIDSEIVKLFGKRMDVAAKIGEYKNANNLPILDGVREREKLNQICGQLQGDIQQYARVLYSLLFELSRSHQESLFEKQTDLWQKISAAINETENLFPTDATVACQGVEGAYSQMAAGRLFKNPNIMYFDEWKNVFEAIQSGLCKYGILPIENSTAGSVKKVYDLMINNNFYIVKSARVKINHTLLGKKGAGIADVKEIFSHEQAILQCSEFLESLDKDVKVTRVPNTAVAAKMVAQSDSKSVAALCSEECAELYGLDIIKKAAHDSGNNHTRFICISKRLEIYPGADKTSLMVVLPHRSGALYKLLSRLYARGINLIKLESRPLPERDSEFMFYLDLETSIYAEEFVHLMCELDRFCKEFKYLGSYTEIV